MKNCHLSKSKNFRISQGGLSYLLSGVISIFCFVFCTLNSLGQENLFISERVGDEIDSIERRYFGVMSYVPGFVSAHFTVLADDSVAMKIHSSIKDTSIVMPKTALTHFAHYFDNYEEIIQKEQLESVYRVIYYCRPLELFLPQKKARFTLQNNINITGEILYANDTVIVLDTGKMPARWQNISKQYRIIHYSEIYSTEVTATDFSLLSVTALTGASFGASAFIRRTSQSTNFFSIISSISPIILALFSNSNKNEILNYSYDLFLRFVRNKIYNTLKGPPLSPEISRLLSSYKSSVVTIKQDNSTNDIYLPQWCISVCSPLSVYSRISVQGAITNYASFMPNLSSLSLTPYNTFGIEILRKISHKWKIGGTFQILSTDPNNESPLSAKGLSFTVYRPAITAEIAFTNPPIVAKQPSILVTGAVSTILQIIRRDEIITPLFISQYEKYDTTFIEESRFSTITPALNVRLDIHYFLTNSITAFLRLNGTLALDTEFDDLDFPMSRFGRRYGFNIKNFRINTSFAGLSLGFRGYF